jgi:hypothetical protein
MFSAKELADKVNNLTQSSAENILEIGLAFYEAEEHLKGDDYRNFLSETQYVDKSSMIRKWKGIGKSYQRLRSVRQYLPPVFTTIYKLSTITADELDSLIKSNVLTPSVSTKEIIEELHPKSKKQRNARIVVEFVAQNCELEVLELCNLIDTEYSSFITITLNDEAIDLINVASSNSSLSLKAA